jgi:hypothetical protein
LRKAGDNQYEENIPSLSKTAVMAVMLIDIMVTERADRAQHALVAEGTTNSCGRWTYQK